MATYTVSMKVELRVDLEVEADSFEEAFEEAKMNACDINLSTASPDWVEVEPVNAERESDGEFADYGYHPYPDERKG